MAFDGTLLIVSHDREFLDRVVGSCIVFEGAGRVGEYVSGYSDALRQSPRPDSLGFDRVETRNKDTPDARRLSWH